MPTTCWAKALNTASLLLACAAAAASAGTPEPRVEGSLAAPGRTALVVHGVGAQPLRVQVTRGDGVPPKAAPDAVKLLGRVGSSALVVLETYPSRLNAGAGACGAGEERIVRVLRLAPLPAAGTWQLRVASCWQSLEPDASAPGQGIEWDADKATLVLRWISGPGGAPGAKAFQVAPDGRVTEVKAPA